jgi:hypothetical protein
MGKGRKEGKGNGGTWDFPVPVAPRTMSRGGLGGNNDMAACFKVRMWCSMYVMRLVTEEEEVLSLEKMCCSLVTCVSSFPLNFRCCFGGGFIALLCEVYSNECGGEEVKY